MEIALLFAVTRQVAKPGSRLGVRGRRTPNELPLFPLAENVC